MSASLASTLACEAKDMSGSDGGANGGDGGDGGGGPDDDITNMGVGDGNVGDGDPWAAMALLDDTSNASRIVPHKGNDIVSGITFESPDKGVIVSHDDGLINVLGGAVFNATGATVASIAFSGDNTGIRHSGTIDFIGLEKSPTGYIAMAYASEVIASDDGGATFKLRGNAGAGRFGVEQVLAFQVAASGTTLVRTNGVISASSAAPGPEASYDDIWSPSSSTPSTMCHDGPRNPTSPTTRYSVYVRPDRTLVAYTAAPASQPMICLSTDGGHSFLPHLLDVPAAAAAFRPTGVLFTSRLKGIAWFASFGSGAYIKRTTDGGTTWTNVALPAEVASDEIELPAGFFTRGGGHGWLAGYDHTTSRALLLATADAGATWTRVAGVAEAVEAVHGDKLYTGFAIDTAHIWLGGAHGVVVHN